MSMGVGPKRGEARGGCRVCVVNKGRAVEHSMPQIRSPQIRAVEFGTCKVGPGEIGALEIGLPQVLPGEVRAAEVSAPRGTGALTIPEAASQPLLVALNDLSQRPAVDLDFMGSTEGHCSGLIILVFVFCSLWG